SGARWRAARRAGAPTRSGRPDRGATGATRTSVDADVPGLLKILLRVRPERRERLRPLETGHGREHLRHHVRDLVVLRHFHDRDEIPVAADRIDLRDPVDLGQPLSRPGERRGLGADQHDGRDHGGDGEGGGGEVGDQRPGEAGGCAVPAMSHRGTAGGWLELYGNAHDFPLWAADGSTCRSDDDAHRLSRACRSVEALDAIDIWCAPARSEWACNGLERVCNGLERPAPAKRRMRGESRVSDMTRRWWSPPRLAGSFRTR